MPPQSISTQAAGGSASYDFTGFVTQGQVDWIAFGNTVMSASIAIFQRLSGAGVQPTTQCGGIALGAQFRLGEDGQRRIEEALQRLPGATIYDNVLYIGFGTQSLIKILEKTEPGLNLIALCTCLTDAHSEPMAARILSALWDVYEYPPMYKPSHTQFLRLLKACAGVSLITTFGATVDVMLGTLYRGARDYRGDLSQRLASAAKDIAQILKELFYISKGRSKSITVVGGAEGAFVAAVAFWLFGFKTEVRDSRGDIIFTNVGDEESSQVAVQYLSSKSLDSIQLRDTTYVLKSHQDIFVNDDDSKMLQLQIRTPWNGCLKRVFGATFTKCLQYNRQLGAYLGSAARVFAALARCEPDVSDWSRQNYIDFLPSSYGLGFVDTAFKVLPELANDEKLESIMREAAGVSFDEATRDMEIAIRDLQRFCSCDLCSGKGSIARMVTSFIYPCSVVMALTIRHIVSAMSSASVEGEIMPTISGLESIYQVNVSAWGETKVSSQDYISATLGLMRVIDGREQATQIGSDSRGCTPFHQTAPLMEIFLGQRPSDEDEDKWHNQLAFSRSGICMYIQGLRGISCRAELMRRVFVIPGHMQHGTRCYDRVLDGVGSQGQSASKVEQISHQSSETMSKKALRRDDKIPLTAHIVEPFSGDDALFYYEAALPSGFFHIQPGLFTEQVLMSSGLLYCTPALHDRGIPPIPHSIVKQGWRVDSDLAQTLSYRLGLACCLWNYTDEVARCVALECQRKENYSRVDPETRLSLNRGQENLGRLVPQLRKAIFIRDQQCVACCIDIVQRSIEYNAQDKVVVHII